MRPRAIAGHSGHFINLTRLAESERKEGRVIVAGFSSLQRVTKGACIETWFPRQKKEEVLAGRIEPLPQLQWAAVRQIELLQEAPNISVWDMDVERIQRSMFYMQKMNSKGYRLVVAIAGTYADSKKTDELAVFDKVLQERLQQIVNMLWLEEVSAMMREKMTDMIVQRNWDFREILPHVGMTLGAMDLFDRGQAVAGVGGKVKPAPSPGKLKAQLARLFLEAIAKPAREGAVDHDVVVGLKLPQLAGNHHWVYIPPGGMEVHGFQRALTDAFSKFDHVSMSGLQGDGIGPGRSEVKATIGHLGGYRHRLTAGADAHYRDMAKFAFGGGS